MPTITQLVLPSGHTIDTGFGLKAHLKNAKRMDTLKVMVASIIKRNFDVTLEWVVDWEEYVKYLIANETTSPDVKVVLERALERYAELEPAYFAATVKTTVDKEPAILELAVDSIKNSVNGSYIVTIGETENEVEGNLNINLQNVRINCEDAIYVMPTPQNVTCTGAPIDKLKKQKCSGCTWYMGNRHDLEMSERVLFVDPSVCVEHGAKFSNRKTIPFNSEVIKKLISG